MELGEKESELVFSKIINLKVLSFKFVLPFLKLKHLNIHLFFK